MRVKFIGLGALLVGALGCFEAVSELNEAEAVAEALTRGMRFNGGEVRDGDMPGTTDDLVTILPPSVPTVMSPGQVSLMSFESGDAEDVDDEVETTLFQFQGARKHIRARPDSRDKSSGRPWSYEHSFTVDSDVCDGLCNKQHSVKMHVALKLRDGRVSRSQAVNLTLDCSEYGDEGACEHSSGGVGGLPSTTYLKACENAAGACSNVADSTGISTDVVQCVALYQCVQGFFLGDSLCQGLIEDLVQCMADASNGSECDSCASITTELENNCIYPDACLNLPSFGLDASVGPEPFADASMPLPADFVITDSLTQNCAMFCDLAQQQACPNFTDTCVQDCSGGFAGTVCEQALIEVQRCAWQMSGQTFTCDDTGSPVFAGDGASMCPGETMKFSDCVINNPDLLPGAVDAGVRAPPDAGP